MRALFQNRGQTINDKWQGLVSDRAQPTCIHVGVDLEDLIDDRWEKDREHVEPQMLSMPNQRAFDYFIEINLQHVLYMDDEGKLRRTTTISGSYAWKPSVQPP